MKTLASLLLIILLFSVTRANAEGDLTVPVEEGSFILKDITWRRYGADVELFCELVNNTNKYWSKIRFGVRLLDAAGNELAQDTFAFTAVGKGKTESLLFGPTFTGSTILSNAVKTEFYFRGGKHQTEYSYKMIKPAVNDSLKFQNTAIKIKFSMSTDGDLTFSLQNKTENPIVIDWNKVSFIDISGEAHRVIHEGPTTIPPTARIEDAISPNVEIVPFVAPEASLYIGKTFSVFMPLEINGIVRNYLFTLKITNVED